jgi:hypothetical protein
MGLRFGIRDLRSGIRKKPIPYQRSRGQKGTGSRIRNTDVILQRCMVFLHKGLRKKWRGYILLHIGDTEHRFNESIKKVSIQYTYLNECVSQLQQKHEHEEQMMKGYTVVMVLTAKESM